MSARVYTHWFIISMMITEKDVCIKVSLDILSGMLGTTHIRPEGKSLLGTDKTDSSNDGNR